MYAQVCSFNSGQINFNKRENIVNASYLKFLKFIQTIRYRKSLRLSLDLVGKSSFLSAQSAQKVTIEELWTSVIVGEDAPHYRLRWKDLEMTKFPSDIYIYQQLIWMASPDVIVEVGTQRGTSAQFFDDLIKAAKNSKSLVVTIDINPVPEPQKSVLDSLGVIMITGDIGRKSTQQKVVPYIKDKNFLVVDDGSHRYEDVMASLQFFQEYQSPESYMVVEDGITDVMLSRKNKNALDAVDDFLSVNADYVRVLDYDPWLLSTTFGGIIRRR
jgi:cephalosporin hydroxylase